MVRNEIDTEAARAALAAFAKLPIRVHGHGRLIDVALELALRARCTVYDGLYLALALDLDVAFVTADRTLFDLIHATPLADQIRWIGDLRYRGIETPTRPPSPWARPPARLRA